jgi:hypothetical protein
MQRCPPGQLCELLVDANFYSTSFGQSRLQRRRIANARTNSLRRHNPDQVLRVSGLPLSQPLGEAPRLTRTLLRNPARVNLVGSIAPGPPLAPLLTGVSRPSIGIDLLRTPLAHGPAATQLLRWLPTV